MNILFPIIGPINKSTEDLFVAQLSLIKKPEDIFVSYIASQGGDANVTSAIIKKMLKLRGETIVYAGNIVYSAGAIIFCSFNKRLAFENSKFLIHESIPPKGMLRTEIFEQYDLLNWKIMSKRMKISLSDLEIVGKKGKPMSSYEALEIGLVDKILKGKWENNYKKILSLNKKEDLLL